MKDVLNRFAVWLYNQTKPKQEAKPHDVFRGFKVMTSEYIPKDTIMMANSNYKAVAKAFTVQDINNHK